MSQQSLNSNPHSHILPLSIDEKLPDSRCRFLELPVKLRRRIYHEAGLPSGRTIHMNFWASPLRDNVNRTPFDLYEQTLPPVPTNLFPVCRPVYEEVTTMLYGENRLAVTRRAPQGLGVLENMTDSTLQKLRFVVLRLNLSSCDNRCCGRRDHKCGLLHNRPCFHPATHDMPLNCAMPSHQLILAQYQRLCARLARNVLPGRLGLYLICDCENLETARAIVEPLVQLPLLQDCGLHLAQNRNKALLALSKETVLRVTGRSPPPSLLPFRFLDLPRELQLKVLEATPLVQSSTIFSQGDQLECRSGCQVSGMIAEGKRGEQYLLKCFCARGHSAFNPRCYCENHTFQSNLFLVSHDFRNLATEVYYGRNQFEVSMGGYCGTMPSFQLFPPGSMASFTSLVINFEWFDVKRMDQNPADWNSWEQSIKTFCEQVRNPAALRLEVRFSEKSYILIGSYVSPHAEHLRPGYNEYMLSTYKRLIQPLTALTGLKSFFVHLNWSSSYGDMNGRTWPCGTWSIPYPDGRLLEEQKLERMVMGPEYDAWKCGKQTCIDVTDVDF